MRGHTAATLLQMPVLIRGIRLGVVESVLLDAKAARIIGFDVLCGDGSNRFLPFSTARLREGRIEVDSTLTLLDRRELEFYRRSGRSLERVPELADAVVEPGGALLVALTARC